MTVSATRTPVLLAGAGVAGSLTALELAHHGVPSIVVERAGRAARFPDPMLISGRSMELLRRLDLTRELRRDGVDPGRPVDFLWSRAAGGSPDLSWRLPSVTEIRRSYAGVADGTAPIEPYLLISGPDLTRLLHRALRRQPLVDLRTRWTVTDVRARPDLVTATVIDAEAGTRHVIEADYLVGCDGADSTVRRCAGLMMEALGPPVPHVAVYFRSPALAGRWANPSALITAEVTVVAGYDGDVCVAHLPASADGQADVGDPVDLLRARLGEDVPEIVAVVQRTGTSSIARSYRRGRIFLAGRAAHQLETPAEEVDTCIGDAVDLGWRLAAVVCRWAGDRLLAGYQDERRAQALLDRELAHRAYQTRRRFQRLVDSGADPQAMAAALRQEAPQVDPARTGPPGSRPPAFRLAGGDHVFDRLGPQFTLVDLSTGRDGGPLVSAARARGIPMRHLPVAGASVPGSWPGRFVLTRPDQRVAWCADAPPADCDTVLDAVTGVSG
ncbi:MAG TPA: FAD-dependent monooxygenase [Actinoplanes sp.]|nr:FAD-dependent monooxygenase [Actinoplanes sp.]